MKNYFLIVVSAGLLIFMAISCATVPPETLMDIVETSSILIDITEIPEHVFSAGTTDVLPEDIIIIPERPQLPLYIMGQGNVTAENLAHFLLHNNPRLNPEYVRTLMGYYIEEALYEGVNHDIAFAQMCLETGFLNFGGLVQPEWNNFAGLGAISTEQPGLVFPDPRTGVRAHIQHLKAYGSDEPLNGELINPRFRFVRRGSAPTYEGLAGTWAADLQYAVKISSILQRLYDFVYSC